MPCRTGLEDEPTPQYDFEKMYQDLYKSHLNITRKMEKRLYMPELERIAFDSFMTVFLCKAMDLVATNNLMQHTTEEMEWWYNEHKARDKNDDVSKLTPEEIWNKLSKINSKFKVQ